jgi:ATP-dependent DNA helicase PIF1
MASNLNEEDKFNFTKVQKKAFKSYLDGKNIFITGPGGCGKSYFIKKLYEHAKNNDKNIQITSMTGCSAILLDCNAITLHKWGCLGLGKGNENTIIKNIVKYGKANSYIDIDILVIDEISMLNEKLFEVVNYICQYFRKNNNPFGGLQLICSGDFYQLPPVSKDKSNIAETNFCFKSKIWDSTFKSNCYLFDVNFRQNNDPEYFRILNEIREGTVSFDTIETLFNCSLKKIDENDPIKPTKIYPIRKTVENINQIELRKLTSKIYNYKPTIYNKNNELMDINLIQDKTLKALIEFTINNALFEPNLQLCENCQVMCISNINQELGLVNGSQGVVKEFKFNIEKNKYYPVIQFDNIPTPITIEEHCWNIENERDKYMIKQLPIILSWAITIHKSQGLSISKALIDIGSNIFEYGQTYVALSRVKSLNGLYLTKVNAKKIKAHPEVIKFYKKLKDKQ